MTPAELRALLVQLSDRELDAAMTIANTILLSRGRPSPGSEKRRLRADLLRARADLQDVRDQLGHARGEIAELRGRLPSVSEAAPISKERAGAKDEPRASTPRSAYCLDCGRVIETLPEPPVCDCTGRVVAADFKNPIAHILKRRRQRGAERSGESSPPSMATGSA